MLLISLVMTGMACLLALPALALLVLTLAAAIPRPKSPGQMLVARATSAGTVVLVPAHNESHHVLPTIDSVKSQLGPSDRLLVIADNCSDDTAALARAAGAEVIERQDPEHRGKGYALAFGIDHLRAQPPAVVLVVDADCTLAPGSLERAAAQALQLARPVQMLNLMHAAPGAGVRARILEFAWVVKNRVRPMGSARLGDVCHLMGTGMALPWPLVSQAQLATGNITEDMQLGVDLALQGQAPAFCMQAQVHSFFPEDSGVARGQKARWEHGHLQTLRQELPRMLAAYCHRPRLATAVLALDLLIPPLTLYVLSLAAMLVLAGLGAAFWSGAQAALAVLLLAQAGLLLAVVLAWWLFGRHLLSPMELLTTPLYALWKIPVYWAYALRRRSGWVRTSRDGR